MKVSRGVVPTIAFHLDLNHWFTVIDAFKIDHIAKVMARLPVGMPAEVSEDPPSI
jgi:hypothetical protein